MKSCQAEDKKKLLFGMLMTAADVGGIAKPWELQHQTAKERRINIEQSCQSVSLLGTTHILLSERFLRLWLWWSGIGNCGGHSDSNEMEGRPFQFGKLSSDLGRL